MTANTEISQEWRDALEERGFDPNSERAEMLLKVCEDEGIEPDGLCDALQGITTGWTEEQAGRNYAMDLAYELGSVLDDAQWPCTCIDWDVAWRDLRMDGFSLHPGPPYTWFVLRVV